VRRSILDITELKVKKAQLRKLQKEVEHLEEIKNNTLKTSSQEIKSIAREIKDLAKNSVNSTDEILELVATVVNRVPGRRKKTT
jgi:cell fate (sporulation/competence/biofilm development) regulator YmcA (YheA/YmcA/DUF963 family)